MFGGKGRERGVLSPDAARWRWSGGEWMEMEPAKKMEAETGVGGVSEPAPQRALPFGIFGARRAVACGRRVGAAAGGSGSSAVCSRR
jgi:hypothetical protein